MWLWILYLYFGIVAASENEIDSIQFAAESKTITVEDGGNVGLPCYVHSIKNYTISWESGKLGVLTTGDARVTSDNRFVLRRGKHGIWMLQITDVVLDDEDTYSCIINTNPPLTKVVTLNVGFSPTMKAARSHVTKPKGKKAKLECLVSGKPLPVVVWEKGEEEVKPDNRHSMETLKRGDFNRVMRLRIKKIRESDYGQYRCKAVNEFGMNTATIKLNAPRSVTPSFDAKSQNISASPGSTVALPCTVQSLGKYKVSWLDEDSDVLTVGNSRMSGDDRLHVERSMAHSWDLVISDVTEADSGTYMCQVNTPRPMVKTVVLHVGSPPVAEVSEQSLTKSTGESIMLSCSIRGYPQELMMWTLNSSDIPTGEKYEIGIEDVDNITSILTLKVGSLQRKDFGAYTCRASNRFGVSEATVNVIERPTSTEPRFVETSKNVTVMEQETALLPCSVENLGSNKVMWIYGKTYLSQARRIVARDNRFSIQKKGDRKAWNLEIKSVKYRDAGIYRCRVHGKNPIVRSVFLNVKADSPSSGPMFDQPSENLTVIAGTTAVLPCGVKNLGSYQVVWTGGKNQSLLTYRSRRTTEDKRFRIDKPYHKDWNLHIENVNVDDEGLYTCQVNTNRRLSRFVFLTVQSPARILDSENNDVIVQEGEDAELVCNVTGDPLPKVTWRREESAALCKGTIFSGEFGEILRVPKAAVNCSGGYECIAYNEIPPAVRLTMLLTIGVRPHVELTVEKIIQEAGKSAILECLVTMNPFEVTAWYRNGYKVEVDSEPRYSQDLYDEEDNTFTLLLRIDNLQDDDFGNYTCAASNAFGYDEKSLMLLELRPAVPYLNESVSTVVVEEGESAILSCTAYNLGSRMISWTNSEGILTVGTNVLDANNTKISIEHSTDNQWDLILGEVMESDAGVYTCNVAIDTHNISRQVILSVVVPAYMVSTSDNINIEEGQNAVLECVAGGTPAPQVMWSVGESNNCSLIGVNHTGQYLNLTGVRRDCDGDFYCQARNEYGETLKMKMAVVVEYSPEVSVQGKMITQEMGRNTRLECQVVTKPLGDVMWYRGNTKVEYNAKYKAEMRNEEKLFTLTLDIHDLRTEDFGDYTCRAVNDRGSNEETVTLNSPAVVRSELSSPDTSVLEGKSLTLTCDVLGVPAPTVSWYKMTENMDVQSLEVPREVLVSEGQELVFPSVSKMDKGVYKCVATNGFESMVGPNSNLIAVTVEYPPRVTLVGDMDEEDEDEDEGKVLKCQITSFPQGIAMWMENGIEIKNDYNHHIDVNYVGNSTIELRLHIMKLGNKPFYYYTCVATNPHGDDREDVKVEGRVDEMPDLDTVTEAGFTVDETTIGFGSSAGGGGGGGHRKKAKKDKEVGHSDGGSRKQKNKKHKEKKGKKHRKEKPRYNEDKDVMMNEVDNNMDVSNVDDNDKVDIDTNENRVETPYMTGSSDESRSGPAKKDSPGVSSVVVPSTLVCLVLLMIGQLLR
ncbi:hemicentin-2-like [Haliotis rufescens]|uniref:hemicentin-2-like n=1 Tax=Haliotis rufescens TaxID=6454 RepID=UPI00201F8A5F|nr:hemicentin-2-like [Haliotis rufescens]